MLSSQPRIPVPMTAMKIADGAIGRLVEVSGIIAPATQIHTGICCTLYFFTKERVRFVMDHIGRCTYEI
jgi:hypothetical protein